MNQTTCISIYAPKELRDFYQQLADEEGRSLSNYIVRLLEKSKVQNPLNPPQNFVVSLDEKTEVSKCK